MKYGYEGANTKELIQNYKISNDKIIITFLDGHNYEITLTKENEVYLLNQMLEQAEEKSEKVSIYDLKQQRKTALIWAISQIGITLLNISNASNLSSKVMRICSSVLGGITALAVVVNGLEYKYKNDEINELKKYDIYLQIRERLESVNDINLFDGIKKQETTLNINTLDNYSLKDIKKIRDNLKKNEEYLSCFDKDDSNPILIKKISK